MQRVTLKAVLLDTGLCCNSSKHVHMIQVGAEMADTWHQDYPKGFRSFDELLLEIKSPTKAYTVLLPPTGRIEELRIAWRDGIITGEDTLQVILRHITFDDVNLFPLPPAAEDGR